MYKLIYPCTLMAAAAIISPVAAADNASTASTSLYRVSTIESLKVYNRSNENLGKIKDLVIDARTGKISYAVLDFGGFLGVGDKWFAVPWHAFKCETKDNQDYLVLDVSKDRLKNAPGFDSNHWPNMADPTFSRDIDTFYGPAPTARR
jgi:sporulation protein YlmC with PRC-barrel domain